MGIRAWLARRLGVPGESAQEVPPETLFELGTDVYIRELAFWSCENLIANTVSKCEFKTFFQGEDVKNDEYYLWNVAPNRNQGRSAFLHKLLARLYRDNEALVVEHGGQLLAADSFQRTAYTLYDDVFTGVTVDDFTFQRSFSQPEVLYFRLHARDMRRVTDGLYQAYSKLIAYGMKAYQKSRGQRGVLQIDTLKNPQWEEHFRKLQNEHFKTFFSAENAVLPLFSGYSYTDLGSKTYTNEGTRDIRAMIDDVSDFTARAFGVPPALLSGRVAGTKDALDSFLTFCIDPLCKLLEEEINRKRTGRAGFLAGTRVQIDTRRIRHTDLLSVAASVDKLIASGAFSVNEIRAVLGQPQLKEDWAGQHFITRNYEPAARLAAAGREGDVTLEA